MPPPKITVEDTPNPQARKFIVNRPLGDDRPRSYADAAAAADDPLGARLFAIPGVSNVMIVRDFCTVNKTPAGRWSTLLPKVKAAITEHLAQEKELA